MAGNPQLTILRKQDVRITEYLFYNPETRVYRMNFYETENS